MSFVLAMLLGNLRKIKFKFKIILSNVGIINRILAQTHLLARSLEVYFFNCRALKCYINLLRNSYQHSQHS